MVRLSWRGSGAGEVFIWWDLARRGRFILFVRRVSVFCVGACMDIVLYSTVLYTVDDEWNEGSTEKHFYL